MKNLNDLLSIIALIMMVFFALRLLVFSFFGSNENITGFKRFELLRNYRDNEED